VQEQETPRRKRIEEGEVDEKEHGSRLMTLMKGQARCISAGGFPFLEEEWEYTYGTDDLTQSRATPMPVV